MRSQTKEFIKPALGYLDIVIDDSSKEKSLRQYNTILRGGKNAMADSLAGEIGPVFGAGQPGLDHLPEIETEQEVMMNLADMAIETFNAESVLLRVMKMTDQQGETATQHYQDIMRTYLYDAADKVNKSGKDAINAFADGDEQRMILMGLKRFTKADPFNTKDARRRIADKMIAEGKYCF